MDQFLYHFTLSSSIFQLTVTATDGGGLTDTAQILIEVENLNDNLPSINAAEVVYLDSNLQAGDLVIDLEVFSEIWYLGGNRLQESIEKSH